MTDNNDIVGEPALSDLLDDPIIKLVMKRDGVTRDHLMPMIHLAREQVNSPAPDSLSA